MSQSVKDSYNFKSVNQNSGFLKLILYNHLLLFIKKAAIFYSIENDFE